MSAAVAGEYVRKMVDGEAANAGTRDRALDTLSRRYGLTRSQMRHLREGRAKTVEAGLFQKVRSAYLDYCQRQITKLQAELAIERALGGDPDNLDDLEAEAGELLAKVASAKTRTLHRAR